ncbi:3-hydroxypropanoate dehydrogenase [Friedmanniella luteola]|uniref:3-hydroxypropanoate dehydrogenase n=1 Tax=Friedmanniella luteola TaxID=546871 RepID=A0A1H1MMI9_9ACTN|nr:malonic semialdehyde reductase [Friedmanniella luteola]SDR87595.1 3-hydroxypropanoate dehydrogenase [Friedmanniella luteola]
MTDLDVNAADLNAFEQEFDAPLAVPAGVADQLFRQAATAYRFSDQPVTDAQVRAVHDLLKWGPTAMNTQPLRMVLVRSPEARARLVEHMAGGNKERTGAAPLVALLAADVDFHDELDRVFPVYPNAKAGFADEAGRAAAAHTNAVLQAGYFILAVRAAGLAAGPMGGFDADAVSREFFPDGRHRVFMVVNLGHPSAESYRPRQPRLGYDEVVTTV